MPYSDDPQNIPADEVRFLLGDTTEPYDLTDNEIAYLLNEAGDDPLRAAALGADRAAAKFTTTVEERRVGPLTLRSATGKGEKYQKLSKILWGKLTVATGAPYAGGISLSDKSSRELDSDRNQGTFQRNMQSYPGIEPIGPSELSDRLSE